MGARATGAVEGLRGKDGRPGGGAGEEGGAARALGSRCTCMSKFMSDVYLAAWPPRLAPLSAEASTDESTDESFRSSRRYQNSCASARGHATSVSSLGGSAVATCSLRRRSMRTFRRR